MTWSRHEHPVFADRADAGRVLAERLDRYARRDDVIVLALPRGGVVVGYEVALALHAPLDVFPVRKLGVPGHEELAFGALARGGVMVLDQNVVAYAHISPEVISEVRRREQLELERRERAYRGSRPPAAVEGKVVMLVDDGLATGSTMRAAVEALHGLHPAHVVVAVPVGPASTCEELGTLADEVECAVAPELFGAISAWYGSFRQTTDEEVQALLDAAARGPTSEGRQAP